MTAGSVGSEILAYIIFGSICSNSIGFSGFCLLPMNLNCSKTGIGSGSSFFSKDSKCATSIPSSSSTAIALSSKSLLTSVKEILAVQSGVSTTLQSLTLYFDLSVKRRGMPYFCSSERLITSLRLFRSGL